MTRVVNKYKEPFDVLIGRTAAPMHWGNPFSHLAKSRAAVVVASRDEAISRFREWLYGRADQGVEPERRLWMWVHAHELHNKVLGCFCKPLACHGDALVEFAAERWSAHQAMEEMTRTAQEMGLYDPPFNNPLIKP